MHDEDNEEQCADVKDGEATTSWNLQVKVIETTQTQGHNKIAQRMRRKSERDEARVEEEKIWKEAEGWNGKPDDEAKRGQCEADLSPAEADVKSEELFSLGDGLLRNLPQTEKTTATTATADPLIQHILAHGQGFLSTGFPPSCWRPQLSSMQLLIHHHLISKLAFH